MGCGASNATPESAKSLQIDKQLKDEGKTAQRTIKVLLLGTGASGKCFNDGGAGKRKKKKAKKRNRGRERTYVAKFD
jgi:hypothetical protein